jgi:uncharacterized protein (DUF1501 family)
MTWEISRRVFLKGAGLLALGVGADPSDLLVRTAQAAKARDRVLVHMFLRGGADGLAMLVPYGDPEYYQHRAQIALPRPGADGGVVPLDDHFGLHPALAPLKPFYADGRMAAIHAVGNYAATRSHFSAQDFAELGTPGVRNTTTGALSRMAARLDGRGVMHALSFSTQRPVSLLGPDPALVTLRLGTFDLEAKEWRDEAERRVRHMYASSPLAALGGDIFSAVEVLRNTPELKAKPVPGAAYPAESPGAALRQAAQIIKAGIGTRCIFVPVEGRFDTHAKQLEGNAEDFPHLGQALSAFVQDLGPLLDDVVVLVTTEFGRTVFMNGSRGTDHGTGFCALVLGGRVKGGRILGRWPGLRKDQLFEERDLAVTTDYRDLFFEIAVRHLGATHADGLFPGYTPTDPPKLFG